MNIWSLIPFYIQLIKALDIVIPILTPDIGHKDIWVPGLLSFVTDLRAYGIDARNTNTLVLELKACANAALYFTDSDNVQNATALYNFYLGAANDYYSGIRTWRDGVGSHIYETYSYQSYLDCNAYHSFWFDVNGNNIKFGTGNVVGSMAISTWEDPTPISVRGMGISTGYDTTGSWKVLVTVADKFDGFLTNCGRENIRANFTAHEARTDSAISCGLFCSIDDLCLGFNYKNSEQRCELIKNVNDTVISSIPLITDQGWYLYTKCFRGREVCIGCFFDVIQI